MEYNVEEQNLDPTQNTKKKTGRPKKGNKDEGVSIMFRLPKDITDKIDRYAKKYELTRSAIIKFAIIDKLNELKEE